MSSYSRIYSIEDNTKNVVYSSDKLVTDMLSLVKDEIERIDSRILEPSCGNGNFLDAILREKFTAVLKKHSHSRVDFEYYLLRVLMSLYGVEIDSQVVVSCKKRLEETTHQTYLQAYSEQQWQQILPLVDYVLDTNILCGDSLSLTDPTYGTPIVFAEWSFLSSYRIKRRDFIYEQLVYQNESSDLVVSDLNKESFIPRPIKDYPIIKVFNILAYAQV